MLAWFRGLFRSPHPSRDLVEDEPPRAVAVPALRQDPQRRIVRVRVEYGCLIYQACEAICPAVFTVDDDTAAVRLDASRWFASQRDLIEEAAEGCCVDVIKIDYADA